MIPMLRVTSPQIPSGYYIQTMNSNLHLNDLLLPIGLMNVISILPVLLLTPFIECVKAWLLCVGKTPMAPAKVMSKLFNSCTQLTLNLNHVPCPHLNIWGPLCSRVPTSPLDSLSLQPSLLLPLPVCPSFAALGHACATVSVLVAGLSELQRKSYPLMEQTLSGKVLQVSSMPCFNLSPQYVLLGLAEALVTPSCKQ